MGKFLSRRNYTNLRGRVIHINKLRKKLSRRVIAIKICLCQGLLIFHLLFKQIFRLVCLVLAKQKRGKRRQICKNEAAYIKL